MAWRLSSTMTERKMSVGDPQRGNFRRRDRPNLRVEPSSSYGRRRSSGIGWVALGVVSLLILIFALSRLFPAAGPGPTTPATATSTPGVTLNVLGSTSATPAIATLVPATQEAALTVTPTALPVATEALVSAPDSQARVVIPQDTEYLNVRSGPGTSYDLLGRLNAGQSAPVTGKSADEHWWQITFEGRSGWVYAPLAQFEGDQDSVPVASVP
jgi:hypothetical protein